MIEVAITLAASVDWSGFHDWLEHWAPAAEWGVAIGTGALAVATFVLARSAGQEAEAVRQEATRVAEQAVASLRAYVYPEATPDWVWGQRDYERIREMVIPLRNGGPGVALNVEGQVRRGTDGEVIDLRAGSIAPGLPVNALLQRAIDGGWGAWVGTWHGELGYGDLNGERWTTPFTVTLDERGLVVEHDAPTQQQPQA